MATHQQQVQTGERVEKFDPSAEAYVFLSEDAGRTPLEASMVARRIGSPEYDEYLRCAVDAGLTAVIVPVSVAFAAPKMQREIDELNMRISAGLRRIGDAKAVHDRWYDGDKSKSAEDVIREMEHVLHSAHLYLTGIKGPYRPDLATGSSPASSENTNGASRRDGGVTPQVRPDAVEGSTPSRSTLRSCGSGGSSPGAGSVPSSPASSEKGGA